MSCRCVGRGYWLVFVLAAVGTLPGGRASGDVERYKDEADFVARLAVLGVDILSEGFESTDWDGVRTVNLDTMSSPAVSSRGITWEAAGLDVWDYPTSRVHGVTTNANWARTGEWGVFEDHLGDPVPTTLRVSSTAQLYGIGGWFDTNPDGQSVGFLFEGRAAANEPGFVLPGLGAMYPGDNPSFGHSFVGVVDPDGFHSVLLTGTLEINEDNHLEGGIYFGADDFTIAIDPGQPGDYNRDGAVDAADYTAWRDSLGAPAGTLPNDPNPGPIGDAQYATWGANYGLTGAPLAVSAPEPPLGWLVLAAVILGGACAPRAA